MFSKNLFKLPGANPRASMIVGLLYAVGTALEAVVIIDFIRILCMFIDVIPYFGSDFIPHLSTPGTFSGPLGVLSTRSPYLLGLIAARLVVGIVAHVITLQSSKKLQKELTDSLMSAAFNPERVRTSSDQLMANQALAQLTVEGIPAIVSFYTLYLPTFVHAVAMIPVALIVLIPLDAPAAAVLAIGMVLVPLAANASRSKEINVHKEQLKAYEGVSARFEESLKGLSTLKIFDADRAEAAELAEGSEGFRKATMQLLSGQLRSLIASDGVIYLAIALAAVASAFSMNIVTFISVLAVSVRAFDPMRQLVYLIHTGAVASRKADAYHELLGQSSESSENSDEEKNESILAHTEWKSAQEIERNDLPAVKFNSVSLTYPGHTTPSLRNISLDLPSRGLVAVMGPSGSGKSTLASVLCGIHTGYEGSAQVFGTELNTVYISDITHKISVVNGTSNPIAGTVRSTIDPDNKHTQDVLHSTLDAVDLDFDLDYALTSGGANLSGGQRQRLQVARAMLLERDIYIFDEASSAVDKDHEEQLWAIWQQLSKDALVIVITHRLAHVGLADLLLCMNDGEIVQSGTPETVLATGLAHTLWLAQDKTENSSTYAAESGAHAQQAAHLDTAQTAEQQSTDQQAADSQSSQMQSVDTQDTQSASDTHVEEL
ncbi:ATP-binding cassette domain-containing protein [Alloscardovia omnicolens]|uniref:ATP-binding cassette domain-containing protein n=1 Tax=Alloscardovia omnicolens TaxID=419015 RepID=UPI003A6F61A3